jgi:hypothetical protein
MTSITCKEDIFMSALYGSGFYDEADVFADSRPLDPGTVVVYRRYNKEYKGRVLQAGFYVLLVEILDEWGGWHYIRYSEIIRVEHTNEC